MSSLDKVIHYCWFGGNPIPEEFEKYIDSWKKYCPDYEIKRWDESNFDFNCCNYAKEAYESKKWAFVSDYARFKILYENGGLYFDTDVELIKPLDDIVSKGDFMGIELSKMKRGFKDDILVGIAPGLGLGATKGNNIYKEILDLYDSMHFKNADGSLNQTTIVKYVTEIFEKHGFVKEDKLQKIEAITIYPSEYFGPIDCATKKVNITENTVSIHHYSASWADGNLKFKNAIKKLLGSKVTGFIISIKRLFKKSED